MKASDLPAWDGSFSKALGWLSQMEEKVHHLGEPFCTQVGIILPDQFKGKLQAYWQATAPVWCTGASNNWGTLREWIIQKFLGQEWHEWVLEKFQMYRFSQKGHKNEAPFEFLLCRLQITCIFLECPLNSQAEANSIMGTAPHSWSSTLHWFGQNTSYVISIARLYKEILISDWLKEEQYRRGQKVRSNKSAHYTAMDDDKVESDSDVDGESLTHSSDKVKEVKAVQSQGGNHRFKSQPKKPANSHAHSNSSFQPSKPKTGYMFETNDSVKSAKKPPRGGCLACGSLHHWVRDCKYHGQWQAKVACLAAMGIDLPQETRDEYGGYLAMTEEDPEGDSSSFPH